MPAGELPTRGLHQLSLFQNDELSCIQMTSLYIAYDMSQSSYSQMAVDMVQSAAVFFSAHSRAQMQLVFS